MTRKPFVPPALIGLAMLALPLASLATEDLKLVKEGEQLYAMNCQFCHQPDAIGKAGFAPSLSNPEFLETVSDKFLMSTMRDGRPGTGMPPFSHLGRKGVTAIVAYLRSHDTKPNRAAAIDAQPDAHGDPRMGELWFKSICETCHGVDGEGYALGVVGTAIGKKGFLSKASDGFIRETVKKGRSNTRMRGFSDSTGLANLSAREIDDVITYMRTLGKD